MHRIMLSHELYKDGMKLLRENAEVVVADTADIASVLTELQKCDGLILRVGNISGDIIRQCPSLKVIARPGVGVDSVDVKTATALGIPVVIAPGTNARSVAEHAVALAYAITKNVVESHGETAKGNFGIRNKYAAMEWEGHNTAIIGFGNIGRMTAGLFARQDMKIHVYDPYVKRKDVEACGYVWHEKLNECLAVGDIISLHMPSTEETRGMIGKDQFSVMRKGSFLINCARGDIVDEAALYLALTEGPLAGAAVDVMQKEPIDPRNKLFECANFIATPHMAALTQESSARTSRITAEGTLAVLAGERWKNVADPEVYRHEKWLKRSAL